jgi:hypothetical protein
MSSIQPVNQGPGQMAPNPQKPREIGGMAPCPRCGATNASPVSFTWWGGVLGPKILNVVRCLQCATEYNGKTGGTLTKGILIYTGVALGIAIVIGVALVAVR